MNNSVIKTPLLEIKKLTKDFPLGMLNSQQSLRAVDNVSFKVYQGETFGLVGESGSGKTTLGRIILKLYESSAGQIIFDNNEITHLKSSEMLPFRKRMQMIFQDPFSSLNTKMTVGKLLGEALQIHHLQTKEMRQARIKQLLEQVGLHPEDANRYPNEFSTGQRQRICIARALAVEPEFIICDEPTSALDVSTQAQIIQLLENLQTKFKLTYLWISHDLALLKAISNRIGVMFQGRLVEIAPTDLIFTRQLHPYTQLLVSLAEQKEWTEKFLLSSWEIASSSSAGCAHIKYCNKAKFICTQSKPNLCEVAPEHYVACHL